MRALLIGVVVLLPSIALAQDKPKPTPEMQAVLFLKDNADQREANMTLQAFKMRAEIETLKAKIEEQSAELAKQK